MKTLLVTGGCGFIGANFLNQFVPSHPQLHFINLDALTYAANPYSLTHINQYNNYTFEKCDITDTSALETVFKRHQPDTIVHFAAESHVDRSIHAPSTFAQTNIIGTINLLDMARTHWPTMSGKRFHHISTDEVYGSLGDTGRFTEQSHYAPSSPYSASKAGSDHMVRAYAQSYRLPVTISNCSNNFGPYQFPEKLVPLMIKNAAANQPLPVYGDGSNIRDWIFVSDHCDAIMRILQAGQPGETYNVGGNCEQTNLAMVQQICRLVAAELNKPEQAMLQLITFVQDRPGHDYRYAVDDTKIATALNWKPQISLNDALKRTVRWYLNNPSWTAQIESGGYPKWIDTNYHHRGPA